MPTEALANIPPISPSICATSRRAVNIVDNSGFNSGILAGAFHMPSEPMATDFASCGGHIGYWRVQHCKAH
jgi:hypothetical protein